MQNEAHVADESVWPSIQPMLDEVVSELKPADRDVVALRFFRQMSLADVAEALGISPSAAQRRVHRAIDKLRKLFARRGVTASAESLSFVLAARVCPPAPESLGLFVAQSVLQHPHAAVAPSLGIAGLLAATKLKLAVTVAVALVLAVTGVLLSVIASETAQTSDATASQTWEAAFQKVYSLKPDEVIKHIPPPFIPERADFHAARGNAAAPAANDNPQPNWMLFRWEGQRLRLSDSVTGDDLDVAEILRAIANVAPQDTDIPPELLLKKVPGDWIIRSDSTAQRRMTSLPPTLLGKGTSLTLEPVEREVIVVRGRFQPVPLGTPPKSVGPLAPDESLVYLYRNRAGIEPKSINKRGSPREFLDEVGHMLLRSVIIEAELGPPRPVTFLRLSNTNEFLRSVDSTDTETADELLKLISQQTSLQLTRERRKIPTWRLRKQ